MMKLLATRRALLAGAALAAMLGASAFAADKPTIGVVVKIGGIPWFNAMETGIKEDGAEARRQRLHDRADQRRSGACRCARSRT